MLISVVFLTLTFPHFPWQGVATEASSGLACEQKWCMPLSDHVPKRKQLALHVLFPPFQRLVSGYSSEWTGFDHEDKNKTLSNNRTVRLKELWSQDDQLLPAAPIRWNFNWRYNLLFCLQPLWFGPLCNSWTNILTHTDSNCVKYIKIFIPYFYSYLIYILMVLMIKLSSKSPQNICIKTECLTSSLCGFGNQIFVFHKNT